MPRLTQQEANEENDYILVAKLDNVKNLSNILKGVHFKESATCFFSANGLKVTVENSKCVQANAFIQAGIFQEYLFKEDSVTFRINLNTLMGCLSIFGSSKESTNTTALKMCHSGYGTPLILMLEEGGVLTDCCIQTEEPDEALDFNFTSSNVVNKIIMKSECLKEAFSELDMTSEVLEILMSPDSPYFRLSTFGNAGNAHVDYPKDSDMVESFECEKTQTNRMDNRGFLSLQYMIINDDGQVCFVEYLCAPDQECSEEEDVLEN